MWLKIGDLRHFYYFYLIYKTISFCDLVTLNLGQGVLNLLHEGKSLNLEYLHTKYIYRYIYIIYAEYISDIVP